MWIGAPSGRQRSSSAARVTSSALSPCSAHRPRSMLLRTSPVSKLALLRGGWIAAELAVGRVPDLGLVEPERPLTATLAEAGEAWRGSRVDVEEQTRRMHRSDLARIFKVAPGLRSRRIDELTVDDVTAVVAALAAAGYKRETISKSRDALAMTLDHHQVEPNVARDKRVKLPKNASRTSCRRLPSTLNGSPRCCRGVTCCPC